MGLELIRRQAAHRGPSTGMSLVEVVIASFILLILALGVVPMFTRSMASNTVGGESTQLANMATERAEELLQLQYDAAPLVIPEGDLSLVTNEVYTEEDGDFIAGTAAEALAAGKTPLWTRVTTIRQYNVNDLTTPIPGENPLNPNPTAQVKEIDVRVESVRQGGPLGGAPDLIVRLLKAR